MAPIDENPGLAVAWLARIRWLAALGQGLVLGATVVAMPGELPLGWLVLIVAATPLSNLLLVAGPWVRRHPAALVKAAVLLDLGSLTALLAMSGGPSNPFTAIYLVHTALGAVLLGQTWTWIVALGSSAGFAFVFFVHRPVPALMHHGGGSGGSLHLQGMWVAFAITSAAIAFFVARLAANLRQQREALVAAAARADRLAALTTLATGAAHELGSPLGTIAVAAREIERRGGDEEDREDAGLIRAEVERCREILQDMSSRAGSGTGEAPTVLRGAGFVALLRATLGQAYAGAVRLEVPLDLEFSVLPRSFVRVVANLVRNAVEASPSGERVDVRLAASDRMLVVSVVDRGVGMSPELLAKVGQPFFTTRPPGQGLGLGLFLARTYAEACGGAFFLESQPGRGTVVRLELPGAVT